MTYLGVDLMKKLSTGELVERKPGIAGDIRTKVSEALSEIIAFGARIRPLIVGGERIGWIRPLSFSEKKQIDIWFHDEQERIEQSLLLCTSLSIEEINTLDILELNALLRIMSEFNLSDFSLFPYLSAFTFTQSSSNLWATAGPQIFSPKPLVMPDGKSMRQIVVSDHIQLWANLCRIREHTVKKLEDALNSAIVARAFAGKSSDKYINNLEKSLNSLRTDSLEPWMDIIDFVKVQGNIQEDDGYGHSHLDTSVQGLMREIEGIESFDKHERLFYEFQQRQIREEKERQEEAERIIATRRAQREEEEKNEGYSDYEVVTEAEVLRREREIRQNIHGWVDQQNRQELLGQDEPQTYDPGSRSGTASRLSRYEE